MAKSGPQSGPRAVLLGLFGIGNTVTMRERAPGMAFDVPQF